MALRTIVYKQEPNLRKKCREVTKFDKRLKVLLDDMAETMYANDGVGLAAPQVGVMRRVVVIDAGEGLCELINPVIIEEEGEQIYMEACLSCLGDSGYVKRPERIVVEALNRDGELLRYEVYGLFAIAMSHEIDHLEGVLFIDKILDLSDEELEALRQRDEALQREIDEEEEQEQ